MNVSLEFVAGCGPILLARSDLNQQGKADWLKSPHSRGGSQIHRARLGAMPIDTVRHSHTGEEGNIGERESMMYVMKMSIELRLALLLLRILLASWLVVVLYVRERVFVVHVSAAWWLIGCPARPP